MKTYKQCIKEYSRYLKDITHIPQKEVEILLLHLIEKNTIWLHLNYDKECHIEDSLKKLVMKRATDYPLEYITKKVSFYGELFNIEDGVLIPRPQTEILVEKAYEILKDIKNPKLIEIGTGSGVISVMLAKLIPNIEIVAVDINPKALELAKTNAIIHNQSNKITFIKSDLFTNVPEQNYDMVISNPPYIANNYKLPKNVTYEPSNALFGGDRGSELLIDIIEQTYTKGIKYLYCEIGYDQKKILEDLIKSKNPKGYSFYKDYEGFHRGFCIEFI